MAAIFRDLLGDKLVTTPVMENEVALPSPNMLRNRIIIKNKKISNFKASLQRTTTLEENNDIEEEYDSDFGEDDYEDEQGKYSVPNVDSPFQKSIYFHKGDQNDTFQT